MDVTDRLPADAAEQAARLGWLAKGAVFVIIGLLGFDLSRRGFSSDDADQTGALAVVAGAPAGRFLVVVVAIGLLLFAVWELWSAASTDGLGPIDLARRVGTAAIGLSYGLLGVSGVQIAVRGSSRSSGGVSTSPETVASTLLGAPAGRWLLIALGAGTIAVGGYHLWKGISRRFLDDIESADLDAPARRSVIALGIAGFCARSAMLGVAGWMFISAARTYDPDEAAGLDESLRTVASAPFGRWLLASASAGLLAAGIYDAVTFRRQKLE